MNRSIMLVEDNAKLGKLLKNRLLNEGYVVSYESRGDKAVYRILREQPDLVILDIMLPGLNGKQICQTVRRDYRGKILMLTALGDEHSEVTSLNLGADDYLTKPVTHDILTAHIGALLRRPSLIEPANILTFDALTIDLLQKECFLANNKIELAPFEFELLTFLAVNHDVTLSRDIITRALRGHEYDGVDRSIDIRISRLRKLLSDTEHTPKRIKTVHGRGYVFISNAWKIP